MSKPEDTKSESSEESLDFSDDDEDDISTASDEEEEASSPEKKLEKSARRKARRKSRMTKSGVMVPEESGDIPSWLTGSVNPGESPAAPGPHPPAGGNASGSGRHPPGRLVETHNHGNQHISATSVLSQGTDEEEEHHRQQHGLRRGSQGSFVNPNGSEGHMAHPSSHVIQSMRDLRRAPPSEGGASLGSRGSVRSSQSMRSGQGSRGGVGISPRASNLHQGMMRIGSMSPGRNGNAGGMSPAAPSLYNLRSTVDKSKAVNGAFKLRKIVEDIFALRGQYKANLDEQGISDTNQKQREHIRAKLEAGKVKAAKAICDIGEIITCEHFEVKSKVVALMEEIFKESDKKAGNYQLLSAMSRIISLKMGEEAVNKNWLLTCTKEGSYQYLDLLLSLEEVQNALLDADTIQPILINANKNSLYRARLYAVITRHAKEIQGFRNNADALSPFWQQAFELIAQKQKDQESAEGRVEALERMLGNPLIYRINFMRESSTDKQTVISRCAREGEAGLLSKIVHDAPKGSININKVNSDGSTAMMQAVVANATSVVAYLLKTKNIDMGIKHPIHGTVIDIAHKRDKTSKEILKLLGDWVKEQKESGEAVPDFLLSPEELRLKQKKKADSLRVEDGSAVLRPMLLGAEPQFEHLDKMMATHADRPKLIREAAEALVRTKTNLVQKIVTVAPNVTFNSKEEAQRLIHIVDLNIIANERKPGSVDFLKGILEHVVMNWAEVAIEHGWVVRAAKDTSVEFLEIFFTQIDNLHEKLPLKQVLDVLELITNNKTLRIPMLKCVLDHGEEALKLEKQSDKISQPHLQNLFADIASSSRSIPREDRNGRIQLLRKIINHPLINIEPELEEDMKRTNTTGVKSDGLSIFQRAAAEGDVELIHIMLGSKSNTVRKIDRLSAVDGLNALARSVIHGHNSVAEQLLRAGADPLLETKQGTPRALAAKDSNTILVGLMDGGPLGGSTSGKKPSFGRRSIDDLNSTTNSSGGGGEEGAGVNSTPSSHDLLRGPDSTRSLNSFQSVLGPGMVHGSGGRAPPNQRPVRSPGKPSFSPQQHGMSHPLGEDLIPPLPLGNSANSERNLGSPGQDSLSSRQSSARSLDSRGRNTTMVYSNGVDEDGGTTPRTKTFRRGQGAGMVQD